ncbi:MAG: adenosylhomocysteinase [Eubacteriales bacterium]|nr:adenosylhomocysteinase [Eubacteriales bacterium]
MAYAVKDINLAPAGKLKIEWAAANMPVLAKIGEEFEKNKPLKGLRIAVSVHVEAKTAWLAKTLVKGGAEVSLTGCNPLSTQDDVAAALAAEGMQIFAVHGADPETYVGHLRQALAIKPHLIIDDGGDFAQLLHTTEKHLTTDLIGGSEETTTGVKRLKILEQEGKLLYPAIAVNDARCKHLFDNRFGTGQSVWTSIMTLTNLVVAGKTVVVNGFGMCGKGVALRAAGLGARVVVTEIDPVKACEALMEGYEVMNMDQAAAEGDVFCTVTGCRDVITNEHFPKMKDGVILCNAGHFDVEINLNQLAASSKSINIVRPNIQAYEQLDGRRIHILAEGRLVNLAGGDGHPAEIMDMSFALQAMSVLYLAQIGKTLKPGVYNLPAEIDDRVASLLLEHKKRSIDVLTPEQAYYLDNWDLEMIEN